MLVFQEDDAPPSAPIAGTPPADERLLEQLRTGDAEAGDRFVRSYYPGIYRYLLWLTGCPEMAEDLTQETFLQAWRHLDRFVPRAPLRAWLHRIAHREFLQATRGRRSLISLEEADELAAPGAGELTEAVELRAVIDRLPVDEREMLVLHYLEGYEYREIAGILGVPVGRVRHRLSAARRRLQQELGEGDLSYLNLAPEAVLRRWAWLPLEALTALEARLSLVSAGWLMPVRLEGSSMHGSSDKGDHTMEDKAKAGMSRRQLLEAAGSAAAAVAGLAGSAAAATSANEAEIIDERLTRKVTCAFKGTALSNLCRRLQEEADVHLAAGPSVADEKVTLFCKKLPLREVMRQLSRPFGYTWLRSGTPGQYRYELAEDLRSQLLDEELRNRDRNQALLALDGELGRYRQYLDLPPDEALARARNATGEEKQRLERYASWGWGPVQIYFRLTPADMAALRAGQRLNFSAQPQEGERTLPADLERGVLQSLRDVRLVKTENGYRVAREAGTPKGVPPAEVPEARGRVSIEIDQDEAGKMVFDVTSGITGIYPGGRSSMSGGYLAVGESPSVRSPENGVANRALARDPALAARITVMPQPAYQPSPPAASSGRDLLPARGYFGSLPAQPMVTTAEVLEAIHRATGIPLVADYYTRLYPAASLSLQDRRASDALNDLCDTMRLRWRKDGEWLQFRSTSYFQDRLKEVPNRFLERWSAARKEHGFLPLDDLCEIVRLPQAQLDAEEMAEGARVLYGLREWDLFPRRGGLRPYLQHLAAFTPAQRQQMQTPGGLPLIAMSLTQQQGFLTLALGPDGNGTARLEDLVGARMRVDYAVPGTYEWSPLPEEGRLFPDATSPFTAEALLPRVRERTREAALLAARRIDPQVSETQIHPTEPALMILYLPGLGSPLSTGGVHVARTTEKRRMALRAP